MNYFGEDQLQHLARTKEIVIETRRSSQARSHRTAIWIIVEENSVYVRSYRGRAGQWFQEITTFPVALLHTRGEQLVVRAIPIADEATISRVSQRLLEKYPTSSYASPMVRDEILETTLRLEPTSLTPVAHQDEYWERRNLFSQEGRDFLLNGTKTGKLATVRADRRPHVVPVAFDLDEDTLMMQVARTSVKAQNMLRDPRVCLCVDVEMPPYAYMQIEGLVEMSADLSALVYWGRRLVSRYEGPERAEAYIKREDLARELVVRLIPTNVLFRKNIGEGY